MTQITVSRDKKKFIKNNGNLIDEKPICDA